LTSGTVVLRPMLMGVPNACRYEGKNGNEHHQTYSS
jgi:hypothetical protein